MTSRWKHAEIKQNITVNDFFSSRQWRLCVYQCGTLPPGFSPAAPARWIWSSMDLSRIRLMALSITPSGFWPSSPWMCLAPPKKAAGSTWTFCNQLSVTAVNTHWASILMSELKLLYFSPVDTPRDQSSPSFWDRVLFRSNSVRFLTEWSQEQLIVSRRAEEWLWIIVRVLWQTSVSHMQLAAVSASSRSSRR